MGVILCTADLLSSESGRYIHVRVSQPCISLVLLKSRAFQEVRSRMRLIDLADVKVCCKWS